LSQQETIDTMLQHSQTMKFVDGHTKWRESRSRFGGTYIL